MGILLGFSLPLLLLAAWLCLAHLVHVFFPPLPEKRIGIVIAHPDDEAMFFAPTITALTQPALKNHVRILCLCSGRLRVSSSFISPHFGYNRLLLSSLIQKQGKM